MIEPIKLPPMPDPWNFTRPTVEGYARLAVERATAELRAERDALRQIVADYPPIEAELGEVADSLFRAEAERDALRAECEGRRENERKFSVFMHAVMDERDKLRDFALYYARCPCCQQEANCVDDCTFASDDPNAAEAMEAARAALKEVK